MVPDEVRAASQPDGTLHDGRNYVIQFFRLLLRRSTTPGFRSRVRKVTRQASKWTEQFEPWDGKEGCVHCGAEVYKEGHCRLDWELFIGSADDCFEAAMECEHMQALYESLLVAGRNRRLFEIDAQVSGQASR